MPWKAPYRANNAITQSYNDGVVSIYTVEDVAQPGYQPKPEKTLKVVLRYEEQRLGIQRYYSARQNQIDVQRVIRVQKSVPVNNQDLAETEDGRKYRIDLVQSVSDVFPASLDLTLAAVKQGVDTGG